MADEEDVFAAAEGLEASDEDIKNIGTLYERSKFLQEEIDSISELLKERQNALRKIVEEDLPGALDAANCAEFKTPDGKKITIKDDVKASISKAKAPEAHAWLRKEGHGDLIKNQVIAQLDRGKDNIASEIIQRLKEEFDVEAERKESVHAQTLGAFVREQMAEGVELPSDLLGIYTRRVAVIK